MPWNVTMANQPGSYADSNMGDFQVHRAIKRLETNTNANEY